MAGGAGNIWRPRHCTPFAALMALPFLAALAHRTVLYAHEPRSGSNLGWLTYYAAVNLYVVWCQWCGCRYFARILHTVDHMLTPHGRTAVHAWIDRGSAPRRQGRYMLLGALLSLVILYGISTVRTVADRLYIDSASYLSVAITGAGAANCLYWLLRAARLSTVITRPHHVTLLWIAPARTPGIETLSRFYRFVTGWAAIGVALSFAPFVYLSQFVTASFAFSVIEWVLASVLVGSVGIFGLYSQWQLSEAVAEERTRVLQGIIAALPPHPPNSGAAVDEESARLYEVFAKVNESPNGVIDRQIIASTLASLVTGAFPVIITLLVH